MSVLKSALTIGFIAASLMIVAATTADAQSSRYHYGSQATNEWPTYSSAPFSREANEKFTW